MSLVASGSRKQTFDKLLQEFENNAESAMIAANHKQTKPVETKLLLREASIWRQAFNALSVSKLGED